MNEKEKKYGIIYKATNKKNGKVYIGKTTRTLEERKKQHEYFATRRGSNYAFHFAIRKHGADAFKWSIIDTATTEDELNEKEKYWIAKYDTIGSGGYNMTYGGESGIPNEEVRKKKSAASRRLWQNAEYRKKVIEALKGRIISEETCRKISEARRGKCAGENNPMYGKPHTAETKRKISESRKGKLSGEDNPRAKINAAQVIFIRAMTPAIKAKGNMTADFSQSELAEWFGFKHTQIGYILTGKSWRHLPTFEQIRDIWRELYEQEYGDKENKNVSDDNKSGAA